MDWRWKGYNVNMPEMDAQVVDQQGAHPTAQPTFLHFLPYLGYHGSPFSSLP